MIRLTFAVSAAAAASSCRDSSPLGVELPTPTLAVSKPKQGSGANLVQCTPLPFDSVTQVVGPKGGELNVGPHTLDVPRGALSNPVAITAVAPSGTLRWIRFAPDGLVFLQPASLSMNYKKCKTQPSQTPRIAQVSDSLNVLEYLTVASTDKRTKWLIGDLNHFSNYAIAW